MFYLYVVDSVNYQTFFMEVVVISLAFFPKLQITSRKRRKWSFQATNLYLPWKVWRRSRCCYEIHEIGRNTSAAAKELRATTTTTQPRPGRDRVAEMDLFLCLSFAASKARVYSSSRDAYFPRKRFRRCKKSWLKRSTQITPPCNYTVQAGRTKCHCILFLEKATLRIQQKSRRSKIARDFSWKSGIEAIPRAPTPPAFTRRATRNITMRFATRSVRKACVAGISNTSSSNCLPKSRDVQNSHIFLRYEVAASAETQRSW